MVKNVCCNVKSCDISTLSGLSGVQMQQKDEIFQFVKKTSETFGSSVRTN